MNQSSEFRRCPVTGRTVVFAPRRAERPMTLRHAEPHHRGREPAGPCPFCPGSEAETPPEVFAISDAAGWQLRVVPNKFPAVEPDAPAFGFHEVLIECRDHLINPTDLTNAQLANVFVAYRERLRHYHAVPGVEAVSIFKNVGAEAGASLAHLHSQLVALPFVPEALQLELARCCSLAFPPSPLEGEGWSGGYELANADKLRPGTPSLTPHPNPPPQGGREQIGRSPCALIGATACVFCEMTSEPARLVAESPGFVAACPVAPRFAYETWVLPKAHEPRFETIVAVEELAALMRRLLAALDRVLDFPAYNWVLHTSPRAESPRFHWHFELLPRLTRVAGFEWGSGVFINDTFPERATAELRDKLSA